MPEDRGRCPQRSVTLLERGVGGQGNAQFTGNSFKFSPNLHFFHFCRNLCSRDISCDRGWAHEIHQVWTVIVRASSCCCCKTLPCPALQWESLGDSVVIIWSSQSCSGGAWGCGQGCGPRPGRGVRRTQQPLIRGVTRPG